MCTNRDSLDQNRHSNRSSPASAQMGYQISNLIRSNSQNSNDSGRHHSADRAREAEKNLIERHREATMLGDIKVKESRSPGKEVQERRSSEDQCKPIHRSPSPYSKAINLDTGHKTASAPPPQNKDVDRKEPPSEMIHKVKNDMKIKEERKEEQEVMVVGSEPSPQPSVPPPPPAPPTRSFKQHMSGGEHQT